MTDQTCDRMVRDRAIQETGRRGIGEEFAFLMDHAAAEHQKAKPARLIVNVTAALLAGIWVSPAAAFAWAIGAALLDRWTRPTARRLLTGAGGQGRPRLVLAMNIVATNLWWLGLALMLATTGDPVLQIAAAVLATSLVMLTVILFHATPITYFLVGAAPASVAAFLIALEPYRPIIDYYPVCVVLGAGLLFVLGRARETPSAQRSHRTVIESEHQYRTLADHVADVIGRTSLDRRRLYVSPSIEKLLGYSVAEVLAMDGLQYVHPDDRPGLEAKLDDFIYAKSAINAEYRVMHKDGSIRWVETGFTLIPPQFGRTQAEVVSVTRDVTARKALEAELIEAKERAETAAAAKADFLANMTHELRTPLNAVIGFSDVLRASPDISPRDARHVRLIGEAGSALLATVDSVLDCSRLEADAVDLVEEGFDPRVLADGVAAMLAPAVAAKGISLEVCGEAGGRLVGDACRIRQVLLNLVGNAVKFTLAGGVRVELDQDEAGLGRRRLRVRVVDTGIGMGPAHLTAAFDRFTQAEPSISRRFGGAGLGLTISKRIIELMGGRIGGESVEGKGSTFWFELELPCAPAEARSEATAEPERPLRILVVDDVAVNREVISALLAPFEVEIDMAVDGEEAVAAVETRRYDLVLMDVQMPVMDGLTATRRIRQSPQADRRSTPIVAVTANVLPEQVAGCLDAGMDGHLGKPVDAQKLLETVARWADPETSRRDAAAAA